MAENPGGSTGDNEMARSGAANRDGSQAVNANLPMVVAPKLGAGDEDVDENADAADETAAPAARAHSSRLLMLAGTVAFAAAFAAFVGSVSGSGLARYLYPPTPLPAVEATADAMRQVKLELAELSAVKANLDAATKSTMSQFANIGERLDRLDQRVASAASETTGSIAAASPPAPAASSLPTTEAPKLTDRILQDWVVQDVQDGRALVESRYGGIYDVGAGSFLPGVGRVDAVKRQDGQWVVLTARGTITSGR